MFQLYLEVTTNVVRCTVFLHTSLSTATMLITTRRTILLSQILFLIVSLNLYYPMQPDASVCVCLVVWYMKLSKVNVFLLYNRSLQCLFHITLIYHADMFQTRVAYSLSQNYMDSLSPPPQSPTTHAATVHHYTQSYGE
jgi:hypothetical protein